MDPQRKKNMVSDSMFSVFSPFMDGSQVDEFTSFPSTGQCHYPRVGSNQIKHHPLNLNRGDRSFLLPNQGPYNLMPSITMNSEAKPSDSCCSGSLNGEAASSSASNSDGNDFSKQILKHISSTLMEENMEDKLSLFCDPSALQATEKSLHEVIILGRDRSNSSSAGNINCADNSREDQKPADNRDNSRSSFLASSSSDCFSLSFSSPVSQPSSINRKGLVLHVNHNLAAPANEFLVQYDSLMASQYKRGFEEPCEFVPIDIACTDATENGYMSAAMKKQRLKVGINESEQQGIFYGLRGRQNHEKEGRIHEESTASMEELEISEMFDKMLLSEEEPEPFTSTDGKTSNAAARDLFMGAHTRCSSSRKNRAKKGKINEDMMNLRSLLVLCAEAISAGDSRNSADILKQIRLRCSPLGDASQRLAYVFANGLHARLAGTAVQNVSTCMTLKRTPISHLIKPHQTHLKAFSFRKNTMSFADNMILKVAKTAKTLHVVDFGISLGCQWPLLIRLLSRRPGGPPNLRLTGIEYPQHGLNPEERIAEAGRHLAKYCKRFGVPFEYNAIASRQWETIKIQELKIHRNEVLAVNCRYRFDNLLDETVVVDNPREAVLKLIREMRPDIFVLSVVNGNFNSPFFLPRFRQAIFHFHALYEIFDCHIPRHDINRFNIEREYYGRQIMNIVACEGKDRVERPETYKQWHRRVSQVGFKQRPLDKALMKKYMDKVRAAHQKDMVFLEDGNWMLQGWKGRILEASSCWEPA